MLTDQHVAERVRQGRVRPCLQYYCLMYSPACRRPRAEQQEQAVWETLRRRQTPRGCLEASLGALPVVLLAPFGWRP